MILKNLRKLDPCEDGLAYAESHRSLHAAWDACERGDWMLWLLGRLSGPPESASRRKLVLAACACARLSLKHVSKGEKRPRAAIEAAEDWAKGGETTLNQVRNANAAANAAYAANAAATAAAYAAYAAADNAAAHAAYAAKREANLKKCADIVRSMYPKAPSLRARGKGEGK